MAKSHPAQFDHQGVPQLAPWTRNILASFTLLACLASLSTILLHNDHGIRLASAVGNGLAALDLSPLARLTDTSSGQPAAESPNMRKYRAVGDYIARRYRVSSEMTTSVVAQAHAIGAEMKIDPLLILAVISVESRFNPHAESVMGAKGLMQIIPRYHTDKFGPLGGEQVAFDLQANIVVGAKILKEYLRRTGDVADALQMYVGASSEENENGYSGKVMAERDRLAQVLSQFEHHQRTALRQPAVKSLGAAI
ncbi:MAG: lytic transglycosylase protein [Betaproteobacteria bacterium]|nr:lytic transglycosylase protein [Betaproteobacteria bacterium]